MTQISANTRTFGILGYPVRHSLSPAMQTAAFAALGIDARYLAYEVPPKAFEPALLGAARLGFGGLNVTVPHKREAFRLAASLDPSAVLTGAVNTLVPCEGGWRGHNTDAPGFAGAVIDELGFVPRGGRAAILGAGGAARAAVVGLCHAGIQEILISNRNMEGAHALVADLAKRVGPVRLEALTPEAIPARLAAADLLASATPLGLDPQGQWPWPLERIDAGVLVYDMAYGAAETVLVRQALDRGMRAASGRRMLLLQGAEGFRLWTGREPPLEVMESVLSQSR